MGLADFTTGPQGNQCIFGTQDIPSPFLLFYESTTLFYPDIPSVLPLLVLILQSLWCLLCHRLDHVLRLPTPLYFLCFEH